MNVNNLAVYLFVALISILFYLSFKKFIILLIVLLIGYFIGYLCFKNDYLLPNFLVAIFQQLSDNDFKNNNRKKLYSRTNKVTLSTTSAKVLNGLNNNKATIRRSQSMQPASGSIDENDAATTTTSLDNNTNKTENEISTEFEKFQNTHPWQSIDLPENIDKALENILSLVIRNYILSWYSKISTDDGLVYEIKCLFRHIVACFILRLKQVNVTDFATNKLNTILFNHIKNFYDHYEELKATNKEIDFNLLNSILSSKYKSKMHVALLSRKHEVTYLREICAQILPLILPDAYVHKSSLDLIGEIAVSNLLLNGLDIIAEPSTMNKIVMRLVSKSHANLDPSVQYKNVQLLRHWCQMNGCIYKTNLAPTFKDTLDDNEILHHFINFLHSQNSIAILQLYLTLKEIIKTSTQETVISESKRKSIFDLLNELKIWCNYPSNKSILKLIRVENDDKNEHLYDSLNILISSFTSSLTRNQTFIDDNSHDSLSKTFFGVQNLIKDIYYSSFIKSEHVYKHLIGEKNEANYMTNIDEPLLNLKSNGYKNEIDVSSINGGGNSPLLQKIDEIDSHEDNLSDRVLDSNIIADLKEIIDSVSINLSIGKTSNENFNVETSDEDEAEEATAAVDRLSLSSNGNMGSNLNNENNNRNSNNNLANLNNLKILIDDIEELIDKNNKAWYVFVIHVWNTRLPQQFTDDGECCTSWSVKRKYDEFYVLDSRLREFHGFDNLDIQLPSRNRALFRNSQNMEFMRSIKSDFSKYLQSLLSNPILSMSELLRSFLDPQSIDFSSSIFNDITNLGKKVKGVPLKLRLERGQSLDSFLQFLLSSVKPTKAKSSGNYVVYEDIIENKLNKDMYIDSLSRNQSSSNEAFNPTAEIRLFTPYDSFLYLMNKIYKIPSYLFIFLFSIQKLVQMSFDAVIGYFIKRKITELTQPYYVAHLIDAFRELIFGVESTSNRYDSGTLDLNNKLSELNDLEKDESIMYENTIDAMSKYITEDLLETIFKNAAIHEKCAENISNGNRLILNVLQYPIWNKHLTYQLLDAVIEELFPELVSSSS